MNEMIQEKQAKGSSTAQSESRVKVSENVQHELLHRLYRLDKKYLDSFRILRLMKSTQVFEYFDKGYPEFDSGLIIKHLILLLSIDSKKTLKHLLGAKPQEAVQEK